MCFFSSFFSQSTNKVDCTFKNFSLLASHSCYRGSHVEALVPGLLCLPLSEVHVDVGGYKIIHLVALFKRRHRDKEGK